MPSRHSDAPSPCRHAFFNSLLEQEAEDDAQTERHRLEKARSDLDKAAALRASIRELGAELVSLVPDEASCPLCGEDHGEGGLRRRTEDFRAADETHEALSSLSRKLALARQTSEEISGRLERRREYDSLLRDLSQPADVDTVDDAIKALQQATRHHEGTLADLQALDRLTEQLDEHALTPSEAVDFARDLQRGAELDLFAVTRREISDALATATRQYEETQDSVALASEELAAAESEIKSLVENAFQGLREPDHVLPLIPERQSAASRGSGIIEAVSRTLEIDGETDLSELRSRLDSTLRTLRATISFERQLRESSERLRWSKAELQASQAKLDKIKEPRQRVEEAFTALGELRRDQSVSQTIENFLSSYKDAILEIFRAIHAPAEFST